MMLGSYVVAWADPHAPLASVIVTQRPLQAAVDAGGGLPPCDILAAPKGKGSPTAKRLKAFRNSEAATAGAVIIMPPIITAWSRLSGGAALL